MLLAVLLSHKLTITIIYSERLVFLSERIIQKKTSALSKKFNNLAWESIYNSASFFVDVAKPLKCI